MDSQISKASGDAINGKHPVSSGVSHLFGLTNPSTILGRISSIIVFAIQCEAFWTFTHVLKKCLKGMPPLFTDAYSPIAIIAMISERWSASSNHVGPRSVSSAIGVMTTVTVLCSDLQGKTPTRLRFSMHKIVPLRNYFLSTFAKAFEPRSCAFSIRGFCGWLLANHLKPSECLSDYWFRVSH